MVFQSSQSNPFHIFFSLKLHLKLEGKKIKSQVNEGIQLGNLGLLIHANIVL